MSLEFAINTAKVRQIARNQMILDKKFQKQIIKLTQKVYNKKIEPKKFWKEYKKILLTSLTQNKKILTKLFKKIEKQPKQQQNKKPLIDLKLPE